MTGFAMFLHAIISILLVVIILMQSGRGGGLTEGFASAESMFGAQTNQLLIKTTTVMATIFFITCLGLAVLSSQTGKSLMSGNVAPETQQAVFPESVEPLVDEAGEAVDESAAQIITDIEPITEPLLDEEPIVPAPESN